MTKNDLLFLIDIKLKPLGYQKKGTSWYKENSETITVFALDKSRWGEIYYVYLCVLFKDLSDDKRPKFYKCHSNIRVEHFGENTEEYLNLENNMDDKARKTRVGNLLDMAISILNQEETVIGFKKLISKYNHDIFWLTDEAKKLLGID